MIRSCLLAAFCGSIFLGNIVKSPVVALRLYRITARKRRGRYAESAHRILKDKTFKGNGPSTWRAHRRGTISSYQYELKTYKSSDFRVQ